MKGLNKQRNVNEFYDVHVTTRVEFVWQKKYHFQLCKNIYNKEREREEEKERYIKEG